MKLSFLFWQLQMPIVNVQQEVRYEKSVISSDSCYFSFLSDFKKKCQTVIMVTQKVLTHGFGLEGRRDIKL